MNFHSNVLALSGYEQTGMQSQTDFVPFSRLDKYLHCFTFTVKNCEISKRIALIFTIPNHFCTTLLVVCRNKNLVLLWIVSGSEPRWVRFVAKYDAFVRYVVSHGTITIKILAF